jgi:drug/metabolite transporter (DMT)-like permease
LIAPSAGCGRGGDGTAASTPAKPPTVKVVAALLSIYLIWGSTYLGIRVVVETIPPFLSAGFRFTLAGLALLIIVRARGAVIPARAEWKPAFIAGGFLLVGGNGLVSYAEQTVPSGITALLIAIVPLFVVLLEWAGPGRVRPTWGVVCGIALGLVGVAVLVDPTAAGASGIDPVGAAILLVACFLWSIGTLYGGKAKMADPPLLAIGMQMFAGGLLLLATGAAVGELGRLNLTGISDRSAVAFAYLVLIGALIGFTSYLWLIRNVEPALATTYAFVNPVVAVLLGFWILAEPISDRTVIAAAVIIAGVAIITQARARSV